MSFTHDTSKNKKGSTLLENIALKNKQRKNLLNQTKEHIEYSCKSAQYYK